VAGNGDVCTDVAGLWDQAVLGSKPNPAAETSSSQRGSGPSGFWLLKVKDTWVLIEGLDGGACRFVEAMLPVWPPWGCSPMSGLWLLIQLWEATLRASLTLKRSPQVPDPWSGSDL
jgi:hypothetical protein